MENKTDAFLIWRSRMAQRRYVHNKVAVALVIAQAPEPGLRSRASEQRTAAKRMTRAAHKESMMNAGAPARHIPLPRFPSERERVMFAAHEKRKASGWIRG